jgi:hypothetical protein
MYTTKTFLLTDTGAIQWNSSSLASGLHIYACVNDSVTMAWRYTAAPNDIVTDVHWVFNGQSEEMIAIYMDGHFVAFPAFSGRVTLVGNAGIALSELTTTDSGSYTTQLNGHTSSNSTSNFAATSPCMFPVSNLERIAQSRKRHSKTCSPILAHMFFFLFFFFLTDDLMTLDGNLYVTQTPDAVLNPTSGQWAIQLQCGRFIFNHTPPFQVEWIVSHFSPKIVLTRA